MVAAAAPALSRARRLAATAATAVTLGLVATLLVACGGSPSRGGSAAHDGSGPASDAAPATARAATNRVHKLVVFVVENHSMDQMRTGMPWVYRLAQRYGHTTRYDAITHPSLPNYLAIAGGQTFGVHDDDSPSAHPLAGPSVFGAARRAGSTARLYAEGMPATCHLTPAGRYAVKHNPWAYFTSERRACRANDVPLRRLAGDIRRGHLPAVGMVIPDLCNDAHDCSLSRTNAWMRTQVGRMLRGPDWRSGRLAIVITADEDDSHHGNRILTVVAHPHLRHAVVRTRLDHYSLARSYAEVGGFRPLGHARQARSLLRQFGLAAG